MEVGFWAALVAEGEETLPLKQRVPEVALFHEGSLQACYFSDERGLLQRRARQESTCAALQARLLATAAEQGDVEDHTPVAILRKYDAASERGDGIGAEASFGVVSPHALVLTATEVSALLGVADASALPPHSAGGRGRGEWSLQSLVRPAEDLRLVVRYARDERGQEGIHVDGHSYQALYDTRGGRGDDVVGAPVAPSPDDGETTREEPGVVVPEAHATAVEAKVLALVRYIWHFHKRRIERLAAEFIVDDSGRTVLHGFWRVGLLHDEAQPGATSAGAAASPPGASNLQAMSEVVAKAVEKAASDVGLDTAPTAEMKEHGLGDADAAECLSHYSTMTTITGGMLGAGPPTSGISSAPDLNSLGSREAAAAGGSWAGGRAAQTSQPQSRRPSPPSRMPSILDVRDLQILDDDGDCDVNLDAAIEQMQAARRHSNGSRPQAASFPRRPPAATPPSWPRPPQATVGRRRLRPASAGRAVATPATPAFPAQVRRPASARPQRRQSRPSSASSRGSAASMSRSESAPPPPQALQAAGAAAASGRLGRPAPAGSGSAAAAAALSAAPSPAAASLAAIAAACGAPGGGARKTVAARTIYSQQVLSRHLLERDAQPRMTSTLARQLERYRDMLLAWAGQRRALQLVCEEAGFQLAERNEEIDRLLAERRRIEQDFENRHDVLAKGLTCRTEKAARSADETSCRLEDALRLEREATHSYKVEQARSQKLRTNLDKVRQQANTLALAEARRGDSRCVLEAVESDCPVAIGASHDKEHEEALRCVRDLTLRKQALAGETRAAHEALREMQEELTRLRAHTVRLEEFVCRAQPRCLAKARRRPSSAGSRRGLA